MTPRTIFFKSPRARMAPNSSGENASADEKSDRRTHAHLQRPGIFGPRSTAGVVGLARAAVARPMVGHGDRARVSGDVLVSRGRLSLRRDAHGHHARRPGLQGV